MKINGSVTTADLHLKNLVWSSRPKLKGDSMIAMEYVFNYCLANQMSLKLAGDVFDSLAILPDHIAPIMFKINQMRDMGLPVYYIQGNHDMNQVPWLSLHKWPTHIDGELVHLPESNETIYGIDYCNEEDLKKKLLEIPPEADTLLMHQAEKKAMPFNPNFDLELVPSHIKRVLIGDIHTPQSYTSSSGVQLYYPGSPAVTDIHQTDVRQFIVEKLNDKGETEISYEAIPGRTVTRIDVNTEEELTQAVETIKQISMTDPRHFGLDPLIRIVHLPALTEITSQMLFPMRDTHNVYTWLDVRTSDDEVAEDCSVGTIIDRTNAMEKVIQEHVADPIIKDLIMRIYKDGDVSGVLTPELERIL